MLAMRQRIQELEAELADLQDLATDVEKEQRRLRGEWDLLEREKREFEASKGDKSEFEAIAREELAGKRELLESNLKQIDERQTELAKREQKLLRDQDELNEQ